MTCDKLEIPFNDTWDMSFRVRDPQTGGLTALTGTSVTMYVHDDRGKAIASIAATVDEAANTWTVTLDADFWSHFGSITKIKEAIYTARFQATTGDEVVTYPNADPYLKFKVS